MFKTEVFVFGSNLAGRHGAGAALAARKKYGAAYGVGLGRTGNAYAIPTKDERLKVLPLDKIQNSVLGFLRYARAHPELSFLVTPIGTGLAGYKHSDIAPMFFDAPANCVLPIQWERCPACGGLIIVRNPTGRCDHLRWPDSLTPEAMQLVEKAKKRSPALARERP